MARTWRDVRAELAPKIDVHWVSETTKVMLAEVRAVRLAEVRKAQGLSQVDVAEIMGVSQPRVSEIERGQLAATQAGTLAEYIEALGGRLQLVADFGEHQVVVTDVQAGKTTESKAAAPPRRASQS